MKAAKFININLNEMFNFTENYLNKQSNLTQILT